MGVRVPTSEGATVSPVELRAQSISTTHNPSQEEIRLCCPCRSRSRVYVTTNTRGDLPVTSVVGNEERPDVSP